MNYLSKLIVFGLILHCSVEAGLLNDSLTKYFPRTALNLATQKQTEGLALKVPSKGFKGPVSDVQCNGTITDSWINQASREQVFIQFTPLSQNQFPGINSLQDFMDALYQSTLRQNPTMHWTTLSQTDNELIYEVLTNQIHVIGRIIKHGNNLHSAQYITPGILDPERREIWLSTLKAAQIQTKN